MSCAKTVRGAQVKQGPPCDLLSIVKTQEPGSQVFGDDPSLWYYLANVLWCNQRMGFRNRAAQPGRLSQGKGVTKNRPELAPAEGLIWPTFE